MSHSLVKVYLLKKCAINQCWDILELIVSFVFQAIPYSTLIPGKMSLGRTFIFRGNALNDADRCVWVSVLQPVSMQGLTAFTNLCCRFAIDFLESKSNNIALHINPRIKDKVVVRNTRIGGIWDEEEKELIFNPFGPGLFFDVRALYIKSTRFKIYINKPEFWSILSSRCRLPVTLTSLKCLWMDNTCLITTTNWNPSTLLTSWRLRVM